MRNVILSMMLAEPPQFMIATHSPILITYPD
nr:putative ATPase [Mucilaginibacter sp. FT3.2]